MEGITILNTIESSSIAPIGVCIIVGCMFGLLVLGFVGVIYANYTNSSYFIGGVFVLFLIMIFTCAFGPQKTSIAHQVLIDESVSLVEFNEHYNIINRQGDIYTIKERN
jgi:hypothetical protein